MKFILWILTICMVIGSAGINPVGAAISMSPDKAALSESGRDNMMDAQAQAEAAATGYPLFFEANRGQTDESVKFLARGRGYALFLTASEAVLSLQAPGASDVLRMSLAGANTDPTVRGVDLLPGKSNYMTGNDSAKWQTGIKHYSKVKYKQVYSGIDMVYYGNKKGQLQYDFVVAPNADPGVIRMDFQGAKDLELDEQGNLILNLKEGRLSFGAPVLYQKTGNSKEPVEGSFELAGNKQVSFEVGSYDKSKELVIDPPILKYSTYYGGSVEDRANAIALDSSGNSYLTGLAVSVDFPVTGAAYQAGNGGGTDAFVTKFSTAGAVLWSTYLGGGTSDIANAIAVDNSNIVYVTGETTSGDFPMDTPYQGSNGGGTDAFVTAISSDGTGLVYSTYLGAPGLDRGQGIAVDDTGAAFVTGDTTADATPFPTTSGAYMTAAGGMSDAFVTKFSTAGGLAYSTLLGGTGLDRGRAITIDGNGNAYVTGQAADAFPIAPLFPPTAFKTTISGSFDAFVAKLDPTGSSLLYSTYVGGAGIDDAFGIALDGTDPASLNVYITGYTFSADFPKSGFATVGQTTIGTAPDAYVFKLNMNGGGGNLDGVYSTYLGGSADDRATDIKVDDAGHAYVTGRTTSGDFPMVNPVQGTLIGSGMAFVTAIKPDPAVPDTPLFSTYLGGVTDQQGNGLGLDDTGNIYVTGWTNSTDYPTASTTTMAAIEQDANAGSYDAFFTVLGAPAPVAAADPLPVITSVLPAGGAPEGGTTVVIQGSGFDGVTSTTTGVMFGGVPATSYTVDSNTQITAISPAHASGIVHIVATNAEGSSALTEDDKYTYFIESGVAPTISSLKPDRGASTGDTTVVIAGSGFSGVSGANGVKFGELNAASYVVNSDSKITAKTKAHEVGVVDVIVTNLSGSSAAEDYTYFLTPEGDFDPYIFPSPTRGDEAGLAYYMDGPGRVSARIYNEVGDLVYTLDEESKPAGAQGSTINVGDLAPGVYFCILKMKYNDGSNEKHSKIKFAVIH